MASTPRSVPVPDPTPAPAAPGRPAPTGTLAGRPGPARAAAPGGRVSPSAAPSTARRDGVRPGARPARAGRVAKVRPVRGGCSTGLRAEAAGSGDRHAPAPLRLTERGRRVVAGLSIAIGLVIAAGTVVTIELGSADGGLQLAGASTVVVEPGDTLWSIARSVAPDEDTRAVVDALVELNGLDSVDLLPGAELQLP
jgi:LysM domain-containing protein